MDSGANAGCSGGDCEGEEQDEPSSSSSVNVDQVAEAVGNINIQVDNQENANPCDELSAFRRQWQRELEPPAQEQVEKNSEPHSNNHMIPPTKAANAQQEDDAVYDELSAFRQQWQRELEGTPSPQRDSKNEIEIEPTNDEERAKKFFLKGAELERGGDLYEAVMHYKKAMAIVPDIEIRLYESTKGIETPQEVEEPVQMVEVNTNAEDDDDDEELIENEELVARLLRINARKPIYCQQAVPTKEAHISWLPYEVLLCVLRWVVSADLDARALERCGAVCRALHLAARAPDLWRAICVQTWGMECGSPAAHGYASWRAMFVARPRLQLHGCYISRTSYLRHGENSFQDHLYRPWYRIHYYRYLRFFPDGVVLMWTTAEEPAACVSQLRSRHVKPGLGIMAGHYRLIADQVVIIIKKTSSDKKQAVNTNTRFRSRRKEADHEHTQTFHLQLVLCPLRSRRNATLSWAGYSVCSRRDQWSHFDMSPASFPPFVFSAVRSYSAHAHAPLRTQRDQ